MHCALIFLIVGRVFRYGQQRGFLPVVILRKVCISERRAANGPA